MALVWGLIARADTEAERILRVVRLSGAGRGIEDDAHEVQRVP
jgi:hypothetical protein